MERSDVFANLDLLLSGLLYVGQHVEYLLCAHVRERPRFDRKFGARKSSNEMSTALAENSRRNRPFA
jgi:hypothetical protein